MEEQIKLIGTNCTCGGTFIHTTNRKGFIDIIDGDCVHYEIKNYPHIGCNCCKKIIHINNQYEDVFNYMKKIGQSKGKKEPSLNSKYSYVVDYNKYKNKKIGINHADIEFIGYQDKNKMELYLNCKVHINGNLYQVVKCPWKNEDFSFKLVNNIPFEVGYLNIKNYCNKCEIAKGYILE